jgi:hypothetical protein
MKRSASYIIISAVAGIVACLGGFSAIYILGAHYPDYSQMKSTISALGASVSPVSDEISACWIIAGALIIFFGTGFYKAFTWKGKYAKIAAWLIILYGFGDEIGSGAFKADHIANGLTASLIFHNSIGGIGVVSILLLPLIMQKVITKDELPFFFTLSKIVFITGIVTVFLFLFRYSVNENNFFAIYKGLWQRLFLLNTYIYLIVIAVVMILGNPGHGVKFES